MARILIVDDEADSRDTLREILEADGHSVFEAVDGKDGLRKFALLFPDVVITDLIMPEMEGIELIRRLRHAYPRLPIIAISGVGFSGEGNYYLEMAHLLGATERFTKPIDFSALLLSLGQSCPAPSLAAGY